VTQKWMCGIQDMPNISIAFFKMDNYNYGTFLDFQENHLEGGNKSAPLSLAPICKLNHHLLSQLRRLHHEGYAHNDVKTDNIFVRCTADSEIKDDNIRSKSVFQLEARSEGGEKLYCDATLADFGFTVHEDSVENPAQFAEMKKNDQDDLDAVLKTCLGSGIVLGNRMRKNPSLQLYEDCMETNGNSCIELCSKVAA